MEKVANLPQLQNLIKRDPESYEDEFGKQFDSYLQYMEVFKLNPSTKVNEFSDLAMFIAQVSYCVWRLLSLPYTCVNSEL